MRLDNDWDREQLFCHRRRGRAHNLALTACVEVLCWWQNRTILPDPSDQKKGTIVKRKNAAAQRSKLWLRVPYCVFMLQRGFDILMNRTCTHSLSTQIDNSGFYHMHVLVVGLWHVVDWKPTLHHCKNIMYLPLLGKETQERSEAATRWDGEMNDCHHVASLS